LQVRWGGVRTALVTAVLLAACGGDGDAPVERAATSAPTATSAPPTTEATTTTAAPGCPDVGPPPGAAAPVEAAGDVDGDAAADILRSYAVDDRTWHLQVALAAGGGADLALTSFGGGVAVVGGHDLDGDGDDEIWARTGAGASAAILGLFHLDGCQLALVTLETGDAAEFPVGGSVGATGGVECGSEPALRTFAATHVADGRYDVVTTEWALTGGVLVETATTTTTAAASDPAFDRYATFTCADLSL